MASKRLKAIFLKIGEMIMILYLKELDMAFPQIMSAFREARDFCKKKTIKTLIKTKSLKNYLI